MKCSMHQCAMLLGLSWCSEGEGVIADISAELETCGKGCAER